MTDTASTASTASLSRLASPRSRARGFSILELIGVLTVSVIILAVSFAYLDHLNQERRVGGTVDSVALVVTAIDSLYAGSTYPAIENDGGPTNLMDVLIQARKNVGIFRHAGPCTPNSDGTVSAGEPPACVYRHPWAELSRPTSSVFLKVREFPDSDVTTLGEEGEAVANIFVPADALRVMALRLEGVPREICISIASRASHNFGGSLVEFSIEDSSAGAVLKSIYSPRGGLTPLMRALEAEAVSRATAGEGGFLPLQPSEADAKCTDGAALEWVFTSLGVPT